MNTKRKEVATSILDVLPELVKLLINLVNKLKFSNEKGRRGRPFIYQTKQIVNAFMVMVYFRLTSVRSLARFLASNSHWAKACGFRDCFPCYRTLSRRLAVLDTPTILLTNQVIKILIRYRVISLRVVATDSSLCEAKGKPTQKKNLEIKPTDPDARWGWSETRDWVFGYKIHLISTVLKGNMTLVPVSWMTTPASNHDSNFYIPLLENTLNKASESQRKIHESLADKAYDLNRNYLFAKENKVRLTTPVRRFKTQTLHPLKEKAKGFYDSEKGRKLYLRRADNERLYAQLKDLFLIDPLPIVGRKKVSSYLSIVCLAYLLGVLYNRLNGRSLRAIKSLVA